MAGRTPKELTQAQRRRLQRAIAARDRAEGAMHAVMVELVEEVGRAAVARELGISRQAVQQQLGR